MHPPINKRILSVFDELMRCSLLPFIPIFNGSHFLARYYSFLLYEERTAILRYIRVSVAFRMASIISRSAFVCKSIYTQREKAPLTNTKVLTSDVDQHRISKLRRCESRVVRRADQFHPVEISSRLKSHR